MAITASRTNILPAGIASWKIKDLTRPDDAYYALPFPREGKLVIKSLSTLDSYRRPTPYAYDLEGTIITPAIRTSANFIKLLDSWRTEKIGHKVTLINGQVISSEATSVAETGMGAKWKLISDKDMDGDMHALLTISRRLTQTEYNQMLVTANAPADGTPNVSDTFYTMNSLVRSDIQPAGIAKVETGDNASGGSSYTDTFDIIRNAKFSAELLTTKDSRGRDTGYAIQINFEAECMNSVEADLLFYDDISRRLNNVKVTFINGLVCTMAAIQGVNFEYHTEKDMDDIAFVKLIASGCIATGSWDALWSA